MIESHGNYGSLHQISKIYSGNQNSVLLHALGANDPIRIFKVQGYVYQASGTNPVMEIQDSGGKLICPIPTVSGWFAFDWDYPGARTADSHDPSGAYAVGDINLVINSTANVKFYLHVEAFEQEIS